MPRDAEHLRPGILRPAQPGEPAAAPPQDRRHHRNRLDVVDRRRTAIQTHRGRKWRLQPRHSLLALEALQQRRLFAADVGAGAAMHVDLEIITRPGRIHADQPRLICLGHRTLECNRLVIVFAANIDVTSRRAHRETGNQAAFDQLMRIMPNDVAVLTRPGLALIRIDDQVTGSTVRRCRLWHERPLHPGRESGASPSP